MKKIKKEELQKIKDQQEKLDALVKEIGILTCLLYTSPSPRDGLLYRMPSSA